MRKIFLFLTAIFLISSAIVMPALAQTPQYKKSAVVIKSVYGTVVSVDAAKKEIVVKDRKTGKDEAFVVSEKAIPEVKTGDEVKVRVKVGSNTAESVKILEPEPKNK